MLMKVRTVYKYCAGYQRCIVVTVMLILDLPTPLEPSLGIPFPQIFIQYPDSRLLIAPGHS